MTPTAEANARAAIDEERQRIEDMGGGGRTIEELADEGEGAEELFPLGTLAGDPKTTWKTLVKAGTPVKIECALSRAAVPMTTGLYGFGDKGEALVTFEAGTVKNVPELEGEGPDGKRRLKGVKLVQELRAVHVRDGAGVFTREQVVDLLDAAGVSPAKVSELLPE